MAKSLYSALFDWIVLRINHALLNKKDMEEAVSVSAWALSWPRTVPSLGQTVEAGNLWGLCRHQGRQRTPTFYRKPGICARSLQEGAEQHKPLLQSCPACRHQALGSTLTLSAHVDAWFRQ